MLQKIDSNLRFLSTPVLLNKKKLVKSRYLSHIYNVTLIWDFCPPRSYKPWNLAKSRNLSHFGNFSQVGDFWPTWSCKPWNLAKSRNLSYVKNFAQIWDFWPPQSCKTDIKFGKIKIIIITIIIIKRCL